MLRRLICLRWVGSCASSKSLAAAKRPYPEPLYSLRITEEISELLKLTRPEENIEIRTSRWQRLFVADLQAVEFENRRSDGSCGQNNDFD